MPAVDARFILNLKLIQDKTYKTAAFAVGNAAQGDLKDRGEECPKGKYHAARVQKMLRPHFKIHEGPIICRRNSNKCNYDLY